MRCVPPSGGANTENDPPTSSARRRRLVSPLPVMSAGIPRPLSLTSIVRSSSTLIVTVSAVEFAWRTALLTASRTTASAWSAKVASTTDSGPMYCTDVRTPESGKAPTASSTRCLSLADPGGSVIQVEDGGANVLDDCLQVIDSVRKSLNAAPQLSVRSRASGSVCGRSRSGLA